MVDSAPAAIMTRDEVQAKFDSETPAHYNHKMSDLIPFYDESVALTAEALKASLPRASHILDLGAGTGKLSKQVLMRIPNSRLTLLDFSPAMLSGVDAMLEGFENRYAVVCGDLFQAEFPVGEFDGVVSSYALHHGRGESEYRALYARIRAWLKPQGVFACCDVVQGCTSYWTHLNESGWYAHMQAQIGPENTAKVFENYRREDTPLTLAQHLRLLQQAGFAQVDVLWKQHNFAVYCAQA